MCLANQHSALVRFLSRLSSVLNRSLLDMEHGTIADMAGLGILESFHLKRQVVISAAEAAEMVLRIDNIIRAPPRQRQRDMRNH